MKKFYLLMVAVLFKWLPFLWFSYAGLAGDSLAIHKEAGLGDSHPFFVTVTEISHNQAENLLEISCKMFADDFENALKAGYKINIDISHPKDPRQADKIIYDYVQKHMRLKINDKPVNLEYVGFEKESEAVWCYLQIRDVTRVKKLEIMNNLLYEMYNSQIGIVHASVGGQRKSTRLNYPDTQASFEW